MKKRTAYRVVSLLIVAILILGTLTPVLADDTNSNEKKEVIKVAYYPLDGFFEYDKNGKECGYGVDFLNELKKYADLEWEFVPVDSWEDISGLMDAGKVDIKMPVSVSKNASNKNEYSTKPIMSTYHAIMTLKNRKELYYKDYDAISKMKIGIVKSLFETSDFKPYLKSINVDENLVFFDDYNSCLQALKKGKVDGLISNVMDLTDDLKILDKFGTVDNYVIMSKGNPHFKTVNRAINQLFIEEPSFQSSLYETYFPDRVMEPFTKEESQFIAKTKYLTVAVYEDRKPVSYYDEKTKTYKGIAVDIAKRISKQIGIPFKFISVDTDTQVEMLKKADLVMPVPGSVNLDNYFITSNVLDAEILMAVRTGDEDLKDGAKVGVLKGTPGILKVMKGMELFEIVEYSNMEDALGALKNGSIDAFANASFVLNWKLENPRYSDLSVLRYKSFPLGYYICGDKKDIILKDILNKGIQSITADEKNAIIQKDTNFSFKELSWEDKLYFYKEQILIGVFVLLILFVLYFWHNRRKNKYILEIEKKEREEARNNQEKSEFLSRMSHDIRTPLNVIMGMNRIAKENDNPKDTDDCLDKISTASEYLLGLVNDALDMQHIDSGKLVLKLEPYSGEEFARYINSVIKPMCEQNHLELIYTYAYDGEDDFVIIQDKLRINQVYFNLLSNAVKFTPEGGSIVFHTDITKSENNTIKMDASISDTGIGMSKEFLEHIYEPFSQENREVRAQGEGTGLGLSIVYRLCQMMGMDISVESELGKGTTFTLHGEYPIATDEQIKQAELEHSEIDISTINFTGKTFLLCEDHPINQQIAKRLIEEKGGKVIVANDGQEGVDIYEKSSVNDFDVILMDIRMPRMGGIEASTVILQEEKKRNEVLPIIALTANAFDEEIQKCYDIGIKAHLSKPIDPNRFYDTIAKYIK